MKIGKKKMLVIVILMMFVFIGSISYAVWTNNYEQTNPNILTAGCFKLDLSEQSAAIALTNAYPISDAEGRSLTPYTFTIKNICTIDAVYDISLNVLNETTFNLDSIKIKFSDDSPKLLTAYPSQTVTTNGVKNSFILRTGKLKAATTANGNDGGTVTYNLRIWLDEASTEMEKSFASNIVVTSSVKHPEIIASGNISKTKECSEDDNCINLTGNNVTYDYYDTGLLVVKGTGESAIENDYGILAATVFFQYLENNPTFTNSITSDEMDIFSSEAAVSVLPLLSGNYASMSRLFGFSKIATDYDEYMTELRNTMGSAAPEEIFTVAEKIHNQFPAISSVTFEDGITGIGEGILFGLGNYEVTLPNSLRTIDVGAGQMTEATINMSNCSLLQSIGDNAFSDGNPNIIFPTSSQLVTIGNGAFQNNTFTLMKIPDSVESLGLNPFNQAAIESLRLPANKKFTTIGNNLLQGATKLTTVIIPPNVTIIDEEAFLSQDIDKLSLKFVGPERTITNTSGAAFDFTGYKVEWNYE